MYYGIVVIAVMMFGVQFMFNSKYEKLSGNSATATFTLSFLSSLAGVTFLLVINRFRIELTWFTVLMASLSAINALLYSLCSLKALSKIDLSLYSLFPMLGGMMLPFSQGLLFYDEPMTVGKGICVVLIATALLLVIGTKQKTGGGWYYCGLFVFNGMAGVLSKFFESARFDKTSAASYSFLIAAITMLFALIGLICLPKQPKIIRPKAAAYALACGVLGQTANLLLLIALAVLPASVQYPFVTGGVMIVSTVIAILTGQKTSRKAILAVALSFLGILALVLL